MIVNLVRERKYPGETSTWVDTFEYTGSGSPEADLRAAVKAFLKTPEGKKAKVYSGDDFNWGDAVTSVPDKVWKKFGLTPLNNAAVDVVVNQDEVLC
jgi:hypothetical protein